MKHHSLAGNELISGDILHGFTTPHVSVDSGEFIRSASAQLSQMQILTPSQQQEMDIGACITHSNRKLDEGHSDNPYQTSTQIQQITTNLLTDIIKICDGLYIGSHLCPQQDPQMFYNNYITHIITVNTKQHPSQFNSHLKDISIIHHILSYRLYDHMDVDLQQIRMYKNQLVNFIEGAKIAGESVLIYYPLPQSNDRHSYDGILQSATVATQFLMLRYSWSLFKTLQFINLRLSSTYRPLLILQQLHNLKPRSQIVIPCLSPTSHLKSTQILLLKSDRIVSYNWQPKNSSTQQIDNEELILMNTYVNSGKGNSLYLGYEDIIDSQRSRKLSKTSRKPSPATKTSQQNNTLGMLLKQKTKINNSQSHVSLKYNIKGHEKTVKKNNSMKVMNSHETRNPQKKQMASLKSILKEEKKKNGIEDENRNGANFHRNGFSLKRSSSNNSPQKPIIKKKVKWSGNLIVGTTGKSDTAKQEKQSILTPNENTSNKQKIILSVMQLVGKNYLEKKTNKPDRSSTKTGKLNKCNKLMKSKIRLQTLNDFTNASLHSHQTSIISRYKMPTLPDVLDQEIGSKPNSLHNSTKVGIMASKSIYEHDEIYSKTENIEQEGKQNLIELTIQKLKKLKEDPKQSKQTTVRPKRKIQKSTKPNTKLTILI